MTMKLTNASMKSLAAALALAWSAPAVYSQVLPGSAVQFGMIGVVQSQTLRLSIIAWPPNPVFPPNPFCIAQLGFADGSGGAARRPTRRLARSARWHSGATFRRAGGGAAGGDAAAISGRRRFDVPGERRDP